MTSRPQAQEWAKKLGRASSTRRILIGLGNVQPPALARLFRCPSDSEYETWIGMRWRGTRGIGSIVLLLLAAMLAAGPSITTNGSGHSREISLTGSGSTAPCVSILNNTTIDAVVSSVYGRAQSQPGGLSSPIPNETTAESEIAGAFPQVCNQPLFQSLVQNWSPGNFSVEFALSSAWAWTNFTFAYEQWSQSCPGSQGLVLCGTLDWWSLNLTSDQLTGLNQVVGPAPGSFGVGGCENVSCQVSPPVDPERWLSSPIGLVILTCVVVGPLILISVVVRNRKGARSQGSRARTPSGPTEEGDEDGIHPPPSGRTLELASNFSSLGTAGESPDGESPHFEEDPLGDLL